MIPSRLALLVYGIILALMVVGVAEAAKCSDATSAQDCSVTIEKGEHCLWCADKNRCVTPSSNNADNKCYYPLASCITATDKKLCKRGQEITSSLLCSWCTGPGKPSKCLRRGVSAGPGYNCDPK